MTFPHGHSGWWWGSPLPLHQWLEDNALRDVHPAGVSSGAQQTLLLSLPCSGSTATPATTCASLASGGWRR